MDAAQIQQLECLAEAGDPSAQFRLGARHALGSCVRLDYGAARYWLRSAGKQGHIKAQHHLGLMYCRGWGVEPDPEEGCKWLHKAAQQGLGAARLEIGRAYFSGEGVEQDYAESYFWFTLAAYPGCPDGDAFPHRRMGEAMRNVAVLRQIAHPLDVEDAERLLEERESGRG